MGTVEIKISRDGAKVVTTANGFVGESCKDFIEQITKALGEVQDSKKTPEFYMHERSGIHTGV